MTKVWVVRGLYWENGKEIEGIFDVYSTKELAERAGQKFQDVADLNEEMGWIEVPGIYSGLAGRRVSIMETEIDDGWYEHWWIGIEPEMFERLEKEFDNVK